MKEDRRVVDGLGRPRRSRAPLGPPLSLSLSLFLVIVSAAMIHLALRPADAHSLSLREMAGVRAAEAGAEVAAEQNIPPLLAIFIAEESIEPASKDADPDQPTVLRASTILLNQTVLDEINPHETDVKQMPIVRVELFADLVVDVEFLNAQPKWKPGTITYDESGKPTDVEMVEDGFLIRGKLLEPHSGYIVLRARNDAISIGTVSVDGIGSIQLLRGGAPIHAASLVEHPSPTYEEVVIEQAIAAMGGLDGGCPIPTGCPGGCDDGCTVDVMMLYTEAAKECWEDCGSCVIAYCSAFCPPHTGCCAACEPPDDVVDAIEVRIRQVNAIIVRSEIVDHNLLRIVHVGQVDYDEGGKSTGEVNGELSNLFSLHFADAHTLRNSVNADLVQLWVYGTSGAQGVAGAPFSTVKSHSAVVTAHEIGHCFGLRHDRFDGCTCSPCPETACDACNDCVCAPSDLGRGWHFTVEVPGQPDEHFRTVMAIGYPCCFPNSNEAEYFSNPAVAFPMGNQPWTGSSCTNSALTIRGDANLLGTRFGVARNRMSHETSNTTQAARSIGEGPCYDVTLPNDDSETPSISAIGQDVAFASYATNIPGIQKNNTARDVYYFDSEAGQVVLVSHVLPATKTANGDSFNPAISGNRRYIAFASVATDIVDEQGVSGQQVYLHNRRREENAAQSLISRASATPNPDSPPTSGAIGNEDSDSPAVNHDGSQIAYESGADNLVSGDNNEKSDIFVAKMSTVTYEVCDQQQPPECEFPTAPLLTTVRVSVSTSGTEADDHSYRPAISETGRFVAFDSDDDDTLDEGSTGTIRNTYIRDRDTENNGVFDDPLEVNTARLSRAHSGEPTTTPNGDSWNVTLSGAGTAGAYQTKASNITPSNLITSTTYSNVIYFKYDPGTAAVSNWLVTKHYSNNVAANGDHLNPHLSTNGKWLVLASNSSELHQNYTSQAWRVYLYRIGEENGQPTFEIVRVIEAGEAQNYEPDGDTRPVISGNGRFIAFDMANTQSGPRQVFVHENARLLGDLTGDGRINTPDLDILLAQWCGDDLPECMCLAADLNGDGRVGVADLLILQANWTGD